MSAESTPLHAAAVAGDLEGVLGALDRSAEIDAPDARGSTPLVLAIRARQLSIVQALLARGASVDVPVHARSPLSYACEIGGPREKRAASERATLALIEALLEAGAKPDDGSGSALPVRVAIQSATPAIVERLLAAGASVEGSSADDAIEAGELSLVPAILARGDGIDRSALLLSLAARGRSSPAAIDLARSLLTAGARPDHANELGVTASLWCAYWGDAALLSVLVAAGASLDRATTKTWYPEDTPQKKGLSARALLDEYLRSERAELHDAAMRDRWNALAAACGIALDDWLASLDAPPRAKGANRKKSVAAPLAGVWHAVLATVTDHHGEHDLLAESEAEVTLTLRGDGGFALEGSDILPSSAGRWELEGRALVLRLVDDELERSDLQLTVETASGETELRFDDESAPGGGVRWTFALALQK